MNFIAYVNSLESKRKVIEVLNNTPQGSRLRGRPKTDGGIVHKQKLINTELQIGKRGPGTELTERSPLRRRSSALDCSAI